MAQASCDRADCDPAYELVARDFFTFSRRRARSWLRQLIVFSLGLMTRYLLILALAATSGCATASKQKALTAVGARDSAGRALGEYRIVNTLGGTQSKGLFEAGFKEGLWTFWDSRGTRTGEIHYYENVASGEYRLFYSALGYPSGAGRLKTVGHADRGHVVGEHIGYDIDGTVMSRAVFGPTGSVTASVGTVERARSLAEADQELLLGLDQSIRDALR